MDFLILALATFSQASATNYCFEKINSSVHYQNISTHLVPLNQCMQLCTQNDKCTGLSYMENSFETHCVLLGSAIPSEHCMLPSSIYRKYSCDTATSTLSVDSPALVSSTLAVSSITKLAGTVRSLNPVGDNIMVYSNGTNSEQYSNLPEWPQSKSIQLFVASMCSILVKFSNETVRQFDTTKSALLLNVNGILTVTGSCK